MKSRMVLLIFNFFLFCLVPQLSQACTTFSLNHGGQHVFGKNYDWRIGDGLVVVNKRGVSKTAMYSKEDNDLLATWTSKYGSVTFNQYGREMPMGGMNEAGLVVELMMLTVTKYPAPDSRPTISSMQWIQYQLDNFSTVKEVIASDSKLRITSKKGKNHFLCTDRKGNCVSIEFIDGKLCYHANEDMPVKVLTNSTYAESIEFWEKDQIPLRAFPSDSNSVERFIRAANMVKSYDPKTMKPPIDFAFSILKNVAQGFRTQWSIVYDIKNFRVYFQTLLNSKRRYFDFNSFDLSCATPVKVLDINAKLEGNVTNKFQDYTRRINRNLIGNTFKKTSFLRNIPEGVLEYLSIYPEYTHCNRNLD